MVGKSSPFMLSRCSATRKLGPHILILVAMKRTVLCFVAIVVAHATASTQSSRRSRSVVFPRVDSVDSRPALNASRNQPAHASAPVTQNDAVLHGGSQIDPEKSTSAPLLSKSMFISCLAFLTGIGDVISFRRYGCYANMMTGNTIRLTMALSELRLRDALLFGSLVTSYAMGVGAFHAVNFTKKQRGTASSFAAAPLFLTVFVLVDILVKLHGDSNSRIFLPPLGLGFGMLNAASTDALGGTTTYAMTGHIMKLGHAVVDRFMAGKKRWRKGTRTSTRVVICFAAGIATGTILSNLLGSALGNLPPFTTLGILYTLLLGLYSLQKPDLSQRRTGTMQRTAAEKETIIGTTSASQMDVNMDGWTTMPPGPLPFQDGQE